MRDSAARDYKSVEGMSAGGVIKYCTIAQPTAGVSDALQGFVEKGSTKGGIRKMFEHAVWKSFHD